MPQAKLHLARESRLYKELSALLRSMFLVVELSSQSASSTASAARCPAVVSRHDEVTRADHPSQSHVAAPKQYGFRRLAMLEVELPSSIITHHDMTSARATLCSAGLRYLQRDHHHASVEHWPLALRSSRLLLSSHRAPLRPERTASIANAMGSSRRVRDLGA